MKVNMVSTFVGMPLSLAKPSEAPWGYSEVPLGPFEAQQWRPAEIAFISKDPLRVATLINTHNAITEIFKT